MARAATFTQRAVGALALIVAGGCSQAAHETPPLLGDCDAGTKCGPLGGSSGGGGVTPRDSGGGAMCGIVSFRRGTCDTCVATNCCARNATCSDNPVCIELFRCLGTCAATDPMCELRCRNASQNGVPDHDNLTDCVTRTCSTECAPSEAGSACGILTFSTAACDTCVSTSCCAEALGCSNNPDCIALVQCRSICQASDQVCLADCLTTHPVGAPDYRGLANCLQSACAAQCP